MRTEKDVSRLFDFLKRVRPAIDAPPFFAVRVAALTRSERPFLSLSLQSAARQLIPAFTVLILAVGFLVYQSGRPGEFPLTGADLLVETPEQPEEITIDFVLSDLGGSSVGDR